MVPKPLKMNKTTQWCIYTAVQLESSQIGTVFQERLNAIIVQKEGCILQRPGKVFKIISKGD